FFAISQLTPISTLFPYTTLFRSEVSVNYYQFHIADFTLHTVHLTLEEEGVYRRLLDYYYDTESPIPKKTERVIRRLRLSGYDEIDRKSTRLNSSHVKRSYAVFCL